MYLCFWLEQFNYGQGYGAPFGKSGPYGQPGQGYGLSPQNSFEHSSSPANVGGYGPASLHGRDGRLAAAVSDYGRSGPTDVGPVNQGQSHPSAAAAAFGGAGIPDVFGRSAGFQTAGQSGQPLGQHHGNTQSAAAGDDSLKAYGDSSKTAGGGPIQSSALGHGGGRSDAATVGSHGVAMPAGAAAHQVASSGMPPSQSAAAAAAAAAAAQAGVYGGYPSHLSHLHHGSAGAQYGGAGGLGGAGGAGGGLGSHPGVAGAQGHQAASAAGTGYGSYPSAYGAGAGVGSYYGASSGGRGAAGWGGNYGH
jgi:hypothetical protein